MKNKKTIMCIILVLTIIIVTNFLSIKITALITSIDKDYQKLGLKIEDYDIDYCTIYLEDNLGVYKVYKINDYYEGDGTDYFTYQFTEEKGKEIKAILNENQSWSKEKLDENIIDCFKFNEEVNYIENGYYYYRKICRTSDEEKKYNFTDEEATGWEIGIYDSDKNILYYYWTSI